MATNCGQVTALKTSSNDTLAWISSRCLLRAPWNIDCHLCRDACPEGALAVIDSDQGVLLTASDACTHCQECLSVCETEALLGLSATLSRRAFFRSMTRPTLSAIPAADAAPAPRKRWRAEAAQKDLKPADPIAHPRVFVDSERCDVSGLCSQLCPSGALEVKDSGVLNFDSEYCLGCGHCETVCPNQAITVEKGHPPSRDVIRQSELRQCSECAHSYQDVSGSAPNADDWSQLPLCPACRKNQNLMHNDVMSLFR